MPKGFAGIVDFAENVSPSAKNSKSEIPGYTETVARCEQYAGICYNIWKRVLDLGQSKDGDQERFEKTQSMIFSVAEQYARTFYTEATPHVFSPKESILLVEELRLFFALLKEFISYQGEFDDFMFLMDMVADGSTRRAVEKITNVKCTIDELDGFGYQVATTFKLDDGTLFCDLKREATDSPQFREVLAYWSAVQDQQQTLCDNTYAMASAISLCHAGDIRKKVYNNILKLLMIYYYRLVKIHNIPVHVTEKVLKGLLCDKLPSFMKIFAGIKPEPTRAQTATGRQNRSPQNAPPQSQFSQNAPGQKDDSIFSKGIIWCLIICGAFFFLIIGLVCYMNTDSIAWETAKNVNTPAQYRIYLKNKPKGAHRAEAQEMLEQLQEQKLKEISTPQFSPAKVKAFLAEFPEYDSDKIDGLFYEDAKRSQDLSYMKKYLEAFPRGRYHREAQESIDRPYRDFSFVSQKDTIEAYQRFIELCPNAPECETARKRIIDLEVAEIAAKKHGTFSSSSPVSYSSGSTATVELENKTQYTITVRYSGPDSVKTELPPYGKKTISIRTGSYQIAVSTDEGKVNPFYGTNEIRAGRYSESFYIETHRSYYRRY